MFDNLHITIQQHAKKEYPNEAVGIIANDEYHECENVADSPTDTYRIAKKDIARIKRKGKLQAVVHSHPVEQEKEFEQHLFPSALDMQVQIDMGIPFGLLCCTKETVSKVIWFGEGEKTAPLLGRHFVYGITDCGSLVVDWYKQERGIKIVNYPRDWNWWREGQNKYLEVYKDAGFVQVDLDEEKIEGDVLLMAIRAEVPNHAAIYLGDALMLHHPAGGLPYDIMRLSERVPVERWQKYITHVLRYDENAKNNKARRGSRK